MALPQRFPAQTSVSQRVRSPTQCLSLVVGSVQLGNSRRWRSVALREGTYPLSPLGLTVTASARALPPPPTSPPAVGPHLRTDCSLLLRRCHTHPGALSSPTAECPWGACSNRTGQNLQKPPPGSGDKCSGTCFKSQVVLFVFNKSNHMKLPFFFFVGHKRSNISNFTWFNLIYPRVGLAHCREARRSEAGVESWV